MTPGKLARYQRVDTKLKEERGVPRFEGPLWTYDEEVVPRVPRDIAHRVFVLWAVPLRGEGNSREELWNKFLDRSAVLPWASPGEKHFLSAANLDWLNPAEMIAAAPNVPGRVIEERHYVQNWLARFGNDDWDDVDTPT